MNTEAKQQRFAIMFSDGSIGIQREGASLEEVKEEAIYDDRNETNPAHLSRVVTLGIEVIEDHGKPSLHGRPRAATCPHCGKGAPNA